MSEERVPFEAGADHPENAAAAPQAVMSQGETKKRPTGETPMMLGWFCLAVALFACFFYFIVDVIPPAPPVEIAGQTFPSSSYDLEQYQNRLAVRFSCLLIASGSFSLFLVLWAVGYIVNAISFLPGREGASQTAGSPL